MPPTSAGRCKRCVGHYAQHHASASIRAGQMQASRPSAVHKEVYGARGAKDMTYRSPGCHLDPQSSCGSARDDTPGAAPSNLRDECAASCSRQRTRERAVRGERHVRHARLQQLVRRQLMAWDRAAGGEQRHAPCIQEPTRQPLSANTATLGAVAGGGRHAYDASARQRCGTARLKGGRVSWRAAPVAMELDRSLFSCAPDACAEA